MRRLLLCIATVAATCLSLVFGQLAAQAAPSTHVGPAGSSPVQITTVDLHSRYSTLVRGESSHLHRVAITYARGHHGTATAQAPATCSEPECPLVWGDGDVQTAPKLYLLLWGPDWSSTGSDTQYLDHFLSGLGVEPTDTWSTTLEQYSGSNGSPGFARDMLQGVYQDTSTPPSGATQSQLQAEADAFYSNQGLTGTVNDQIIVATQSGTCPAGFYAPSCAGGTGSYCAYHTSGGYSETWTNLPYLLDAGSGCGENFVNSGSSGTYDGFSIVEGHEYAETVSDPYPYGGWWDSADPSGGEIGDKCAWSSLSGDVTLSTGTFAMQPLFSNHALAAAGEGCVLHTPSYSLSVSRSGTGSGTVTSSPSGISCGSTCSANFVSGTTVTLTAAPNTGSTFAGWGGACSGTATTCSVDVTGTTSVSAVFNTSSTSYTVKVSKSGTGTGTVTSNPAGISCGTTCSETVASGTSVTLTETPAAGTVFNGWSGPCSGIASTTCTFKVTGNVTVGVRLTVGTLYQETSATYAGAWTRSSCLCFSGGATYYSTSAGNSASFKFTGKFIEFVGEKSLKRGSFKVYLDGKYITTVSTYSSQALNAVDVWQHSYTTISTHTLKIVNVATSGHPRVDVDAFIVSS
jgi:hypothetical protein